MEPLAVPRPGALAADAGRAPGAALARNTLWLVLGQAGTMLLSLVLSAALGRTLGPAELGLFYLVTSMTTFAYVFVDWGQSAYLTREVARHPEQGGALLGSALAFRAGAAAAVGVAAVPVAWALGYPARTLGLYAAMLAAWLPFTSVQTFGHVFRARERMDLDSATSVLTKALTLAAALPALALGAGLLAVVASQGAGAAATLCVAALLFGRLGLGRPSVSRPVLRQLAAGGAPLFAMALASSAQGYFDAVVLSKLAPAATVGWYGAARNFMNALVMPSAILSAAAYPALSRAAGDVPAFRQQLRAALRPVLALGALAAAGTWLFADWAVDLVYGRASFGPAAQVLRAFAPVLLLLFLDTLTGNAIIAAGRTRLLAVAKGASVALATGLELVLVPVCQARLGNGGVGLVVAFGLSELVMLAATLFIIPRRTLERRFLADLGGALAAGGGALLACAALPLSPWIELPVFLAVFGALAVAFGLVGRGDLALFRAAARSGGRPCGPGES